MVHTTFEVSTYQVILGRELESPEGLKYSALIRCESADGTLASFAFIQPDDEIAENVYNPEEKFGITYIPREHYTWYLDLLRNEKPVYAYLDSDEPKYNSLHTLREPVGEGDWLQQGPKPR